jgi:hypothetical protein
MKMHQRRRGFSAGIEQALAGKQAEVDWGKLLASGGSAPASPEMDKRRIVIAAGRRLFRP